MNPFSTDNLNLVGIADVIFAVAETFGATPEMCQSLRPEIKKLQACAYRIKQIFNPRDTKPLPFRLTDEASGDHGLDCRIDLSGSGIVIMPEGYGTKVEAVNRGTPILVEFYEGKLQVLVWPNINQEDPLVLNMEGARENLYKEEPHESDPA